MVARLLLGVLVVSLAAGELAGVMDLSSESVLTKPKTTTNTPKINTTKLHGVQDPGYGPQSASRTDMQRTQEKMTEQREKLKADGKRVPGQLEPAGKAETDATVKRINEHIDAYAAEIHARNNPEEVAAVDNVTMIKRQAAAIKGKFQQAKKFIKAKQAHEKAQAQKEKEQEKPEKESGPPSKEEAEKAGVQAEEDKLKQEELKNGVDTDAETDFVDPSEKIDTASTGNWVHTGLAKRVAPAASAKPAAPAKPAPKKSSKKSA